MSSPILATTGPKRRFMGRLPHGGDLLAELTSFCEKNNIRCGEIRAIGALSSARVAVYLLEEKVYREIEINYPVEILSLLGNISLKDGQPFVHAHLTLAGEDGRAAGGHMVSGCTIFALEYIIEAWDGEEAPQRRPDAETGLMLWPY